MRKMAKLPHKLLKHTAKTLQTYSCARIMCKFIHKGQRHCFFTASGVWEKANISACTVSVK